MDKNTLKAKVKVKVSGPAASRPIRITVTPGRKSKSDPTSNTQI